MNENQFSKRYRTWSTDKLMDILENPQEYQPLAVEAARLELDSRQLTQQQRNEAQAAQHIRKQVETGLQQKNTYAERKLKSLGAQLIGLINPIQQETSEDNTIKRIVVFMTVLFLYTVYDKYEIIRLLFTSNSGEWDIDLAIYLSPLIILPTAGISFWLRKKTGWTLTSIYFSHTAAASLLLLYSFLNQEATGVPAIDALFPTTSPLVYLGILLLYGALTSMLCKPNIRALYGVDRKSMLTALGIGTGITLLIAMKSLLP